VRLGHLALRALALGCVGFGGGCSGLLQSSVQPEQTYYLRAAPAPAGSALGASLRVGHPLPAPGLDSTHIMLVQPDHRLNFYSGSRWPAPLADVLEALAVETLRGSGAWSSVEDSTSPFPSDYLLQIAVRRFEADYTAGGAVPEVHVTLDCIIGRREGRDVVASFSAAGSALATANRLGAVVAAFEQATGSALAALSQQAQEAARGAAQHPAAHAAQNEDSPLPSSSRASQ
jgi:cholesterol transport system auxiliary component